MESIEETWEIAVRHARRMSAARMAVGFLILATGAALANSNDDLAYFRQERDCASPCVYEVPSFPFLTAALIVAGVFLAWAGIPRLAHNPPMPDRARMEAPLGLSQAVWERLPPRHRMHSHLRALARNILVVRLAVFALLLCLLFTGLLLAFARHGGFDAIRSDIACTGEGCPTPLQSPPLQDFALAAVVGIVTALVLVKVIKRAVQPA